MSPFFNDRINCIDTDDLLPDIGNIHFNSPAVL